MNLNQLRNLQLLRRVCFKFNYLAITSNKIYQLVNDQSNNQQFLNRINLKNDLIQVSRRFKTKKTGSTNKDDKEEDSDSSTDDEEESDSSEESAEESSDEDGSSIKKMETINMRIDMVLKNAIGGTKSRIEQWIDEDKVRVNNERVVKKSDCVMEGDVVDVIQGYVDNNPDKLKITRCEFLYVDDKMNSRRKYGSTLKMTDMEIDNYENTKYTALI